MPSRRSLRPVAALLLAGVVATACTGGGGDGPDGIDPGVRRDAIREARSALGDPAVALASATDVAVTATTLLRAELPAQPERRRSLADSVESEDISPLQQAIRRATAAGEDLEARALGVPDVDEALSAFDAAIDAASVAQTASRLELDRIRAVADIDATLADIVARWAEGGSRSELLNRFAELSEQARNLAESIDAPEVAPEVAPEATEPDADGATAEPTPTDLVAPCSGALARRRAAAVAVAGASEELRQLVLRRRGNELDERLEELVADPYGTRTSLVELDRADADCWAESDEVASATAALAAALEDLQRALNPSDLSEAPAES